MTAEARRSRARSGPGAVAALLRSARGNVMMMFAFMLVPLTAGAGMSIDYARAMLVQTKLNAIADAAALLAVSKPMLSQSDATAVNYATIMFNTQAQSILAQGNISVTQLTVTAPTDANGRRSATVSYTGKSTNVFGGLLGVVTLPISGVSQTTNATAPDIDFYMLLDVSASMALPVTSAGLAQVAASNTQQCQFACHSTNDLKGIDAKGNTTDLYGVAKSYGLKLRIDDAGTAVSRLTSDAQSTQSKNGATYRMGISTFRGSGGFSTIQPLTPNLTAAASATSNLQPSLFYSNGCPTQACAATDVGYNDRDTGSSDAFSRMNTLMPAPGTGLSKSKPQSIMFIITDGMRDENRTNGTPEIAFDTTLCTTIKARGIRIAILYTEYLAQAIANDAWSQANVAPYLNQVEPALKTCATPGLYTKVSTDQDIYGALDQLFMNAVSTARVTK